MKNVKFVICSIAREKEILAEVDIYRDKFIQNKIGFTEAAGDIETEYDANRLTSKITEIEKAIKTSDQEFVVRMLTFFHEPLTREFIVEISNYGPYGQYHSGLDRVTINVHSPRQPIHSIKHELVHIMVDQYVKSQKLPDWSKEKVVETVLTILM